MDGTLLRGRTMCIYRDITLCYVIHFMLFRSRYHQTGNPHGDSPNGKWKVSFSLFFCDFQEENAEVALFSCILIRNEGKNRSSCWTTTRSSRQSKRCGCASSRTSLTLSFGCLSSCFGELNNPPRTLCGKTVWDSVWAAACVMPAAGDAAEPLRVSTAPPHLLVALVPLVPLVSLVSSFLSSLSSLSFLSFLVCC